MTKDSLEAFLKEVRRLKGEYRIAPGKRSGDREQRRICLLLKDALLSLPADNIRVVMAPIWPRAISGVKPLSSIETACFLADLFEIKLYQALQGYSLSCDPSEEEQRGRGRINLSLTLEGRDWEAEARRIPLPALEAVVKILVGNAAGPKKEVGDGELQEVAVVAEPDAGSKSARGFGTQQAGFGTFAG